MKIKIEKEVDIEIGKAYNQNSVKYIVCELPYAFYLEKFFIVKIHEMSPYRETIIIPSNTNRFWTLEDCVKFLITSGIEL